MTKLERIRGCAGVTDTAGYILLSNYSSLHSQYKSIWFGHKLRVAKTPLSLEDEPSSMQVNGTVLVAFADSLQGRAVD